MRIAVVGAGALGGVVSGLLAMAQERPFGGGDGDAEAEVWLIGSGSGRDFVEEVNSKGLMFGLAPGAAGQIRGRPDSPIHSIIATINPEDAFPCDLAIVAVKSNRTLEAAQQIMRLISSDGLVVSLQNGLGNTEILSAILPHNPVMQGTTMIGATLLGPGRVFCAGINETSIAADPSLSGIQLGHLVIFKAFMGRVGAAVTLSPDVSGIVWAKLCANCAINPVAGLLDVDNGTLVAHEPAMLLMKRVVDEVTAVAAVKGIQLPFPAEEAFQRVVQVAALNARNLCSMVQDLRRGKITEIEALNGAVVREAERLGVDLPVNRTLANLIRARQELVSMRT